MTTTPTTTLGSNKEDDDDEEEEEEEEEEIHKTSPKFKESVKSVIGQTRLIHQGERPDWFSLAGQMKQQSAMNHYTIDTHHKSKPLKNLGDTSYFDFDANEGQSL